MKRSILIIIGIILVIVLVSIWVYVLFFSTPGENTNNFANFNFGDQEDVVVEEPVIEEPVVNVTENKQLRQLTTGPVIGYQEVVSGAAANQVYYAEPGTGHIFSIDMDDGEETRISATTIPVARKAVFTPNGQHIFFIHGNGNNQKAVVGTFGLGGGELSLEALTENVEAVKATNDNTFLLSVREGASLVGKRYDPVTREIETLFTLPFLEAVIDWGELETDIHYVYPKANTLLEGYLYQVKDGVLSRLPASGFGFSAIGNNDKVLYSVQVNGEYKTYIYDQAESESSPHYLDLIPEKCTHVGDSRNWFVCAETKKDLTKQTPDSWYQGTEVYNDGLWIFAENFLSGDFMVDIEQSSGREVDVVNMITNNNSSNLLFQNKTNQTLWMYTLPR